MTSKVVAQLRSGCIAKELALQARVTISMANGPRGPTALKDTMVMSSTKRKGQATLNVLVTLDERHRDQLDAVAGQLELAGMNVSDKFALGGVIAGEVAAANLAKVRAVEGIKKVEEEPIFHAGR